MNPNSLASMNFCIGELAALGTAVCYSASSLFFHPVEQEIWSARLQPAKADRGTPAAGSCTLDHISHDPPNRGGDRALVVARKLGNIRLAIGDLILFQAYVSRGPRIGLLFLSLSPAMTTLLAWIILGETLSCSMYRHIIRALA